MPENVVRSFDAPDDTRDFEKGVLDLIKVGSLTFGRETLDPGWRWSEHVKPLAGTELCEFHHVGYQISGRWVCEDRDGKRVEIGPGDIFDTPPGHDAWVLGDEPCVALDFQGIADWALRATSARVLTTVLFADIVESTPLVERIGDRAWQRLLAQYRENVTFVLSEFAGTLVDTAGDGSWRASTVHLRRCAPRSASGRPPTAWGSRRAQEFTPARSSSRRRRSPALPSISGPESWPRRGRGRSS
jgi:hypothetical protein